ncbi:MAG: DNA gyrase subunit A [Clostridia bacterium]|nr:DNA gyrase subunit A [Clostridia bacterium]
MAEEFEEFDYSAHESQKITDIDIQKEIRTSYIDYAMSVIVGRALPDVRDGLKPVHRRVLYSMYKQGLFYNVAYRKSATVVGDVIGHYHPHGDAAAYDTMVRLAQDFSLRYPLVDGHGNFGNIDGDGAAAYRYTEARMARIANLMLQDIEKNTVDMVPNFDNRLLEPTVLPSRFPNLLVNGSIGIAVGMATNIPPHNMNEAIDAAIYVMEHPDCTVQDLMQIVKGPDFPTAGIIHGTAGIREAYLTGRGRVKVRAKAEFEEKHGKTSIIITELPYQVNRTMLLANMAQLVKDKRVEGVSDIRNESGRKGMRIVIELKRDANPQVVLNLFYKYTQLQDTCAINMLALVDGVPKTLNLKDLLSHYVAFQQEVILRRTKFELERTEREAHLYEGYKIVADNTDEVIAIIRGSESIPDAKEKLAARFDLDDVQTQAIVEMQLGRLSGMERIKIEKHLEELYAKIAELKAIISDELKVDEIIKQDLLETRARYGDERRTAIEESDDDIVIEDLIEREDCVITVTAAGYVKRLPAETYSAQRRGGKGITAMATKEEDYVTNVYIAHSHDFLLLFSNMGRMYIKKCYEIPEAGRTAKGMNIVNLLQLSENETITTAIPITEFDEDKFLVMITKYGVIKRVNLGEYRTRRTAGLFAINLDEGDELLYVLKTEGGSTVLAASSEGLAIHFDENDVRAVGRQARGVRMMTLPSGATVVGAAAIPREREGLSVLTVTSRGFGKRTDPMDFTIQNRGGKGMICHKLSDKTGSLVGLELVHDDDDCMLITEAGIIIRTAVSEIPVYGRAASGVIVMRTADDTRVANFTVVKNVKEEETAETGEDNALLAETGEEAAEASGEEAENE